ELARRKGARRVSSDMPGANLARRLHKTPSPRNALTPFAVAALQVRGFAVMAPIFTRPQRSFSRLSTAPPLRTCTDAARADSTERRRCAKFDGRKTARPSTHLENRLPSRGDSAGRALAGSRL